MFFVEVPFWPGDLDFDFLAFCSITRGDFAEAILSIPPVRLGPRGGTPLSCEVTSSEWALSTHSAPSDHTFVTVCTPVGPLDWCSVVTTGLTMVGDFSFDAFARDELLAGRLAGCAILGSVAPSFVVGIVSLSIRMSYRFGDFNTVRHVLTEVVEATPIVGGQGIFKCVIDKHVVAKKEE